MRRLLPRRLRAHLGRRGLVLLLFGVMWLVQGVAYLLLPELADAGDGFWHDRIPAVGLAVLWGGTGLLALLYAFAPRRKNDTTGFLAVSAMPMMLTFSYGVGAVTRLFLGDPVWVLGVLGFLVYGAFSLLLTVIASWPDVEGGDVD